MPAVTFRRLHWIECHPIGIVTSHIICVQNHQNPAGDITCHHIAHGCLQVQQIIGAKKAIAFDLTAACSGFVVGLVTAAQFIRTGAYSNILVIGADALSRYVDWRDRGEEFRFNT